MGIIIIFGVIFAVCFCGISFGLFETCFHDNCKITKYGNSNNPDREEARKETRLWSILAGWGDPYKDRAQPEHAPENWNGPIVQQKMWAPRPRINYDCWDHDEISAELAKLERKMK